MSLTHPDAPTEVAPGVAILPQSIVNLYFVGQPHAGDRQWVLVDAGLPLGAGQITHAAAARFGPNCRPSAIVLTHGHFDHVGALPELAERWDAPVYAHRLERPYLDGLSSYPPPDPAVGGGAMSLLSRFYPRGPITLGSRLFDLPDNGSVPGMPGWRWVLTPGHTPGHVSFFRDSDGTLIVGDAFVTARQESAVGSLFKFPILKGPPAYYTPDWQSAARSVRSLAALRPEAVLTGHGVPMYGEQMRRDLDNLARNFERDQVPSYGRYVDRPAVADEHGVLTVPPPVFDRQLATVAGVGLAVLVGVLVARAARERA